MTSVATPSPVGGAEQSRARYPEATGTVARDGVQVFWERYGEGEPAMLFAPTWSIVHARIWKAQVPDFARRQRVITVDPRGNGRSDRPATARAYTEEAFAADLIAVMDASGTERAVLVSLSLGAQRAMIAAAGHPDRVAGLVFIAPAIPLGEGLPERKVSFDDRLVTEIGWAKYNRHFWRRDYDAFVEWFFGRCLSEPHSTKQTEDAVSWGLETDAETLILSNDATHLSTDEVRALCARLDTPTLVIQGDADVVTGAARGVELADAIPGARLLTIAGGGHLPNVRDPVLVNLAIREFVRGLSVASR